MKGAARKRGSGRHRDDFKEIVKRALADRVGLICSRPGCGKSTKGPHTEDDKARNIGKACHIHAAAEGGPRFDRTQSAEQRASVTNGIWLCSDHATEVDNDEVRFPAELLRQWKTEAEKAADLRMQSPQTAGALEVLLIAANELLAYPQTLPDGTWFERSELVDVRQKLSAPPNDGGVVVALLGVPGSGKSAFLARLGCDLREDGWKVVAIKADRLPSRIASAGDLASHLGISFAVSAALYALSREAKTVLLVDQLDALADLADAKTERLAVLLSLIASVKASGIPIVCSVREFDFRHDVRFGALGAHEIQLEPLHDSEVESELKKLGVDPGRVGPKLRSLLAIPYWLKHFIELPWLEETSLPTTSQALLEAVWQQTVLRNANDAAKNDEIATHIAGLIAEREELWVSRAELTPHEAVVQRLLAVGILVMDVGQLRVGFAHQTLYEFARARSFVRNTSLFDYVTEQQASLFVRPTLWATLHYLRAVATRRYQDELRRLWQGIDRAHVQILLVEFLGQIDAPDDFEVALLQPRFFDAKWARMAFNAAARSRQWLRHLRRGTLPRAMTGSNPDATCGALVASLIVEPEETLSLVERHWAGDSRYAHLVVLVLRQLREWTTRAKNLLDGALQHVGNAEQVLDRFAWQLKEGAPEVAIDLIAGYLERQLSAIETSLPRSEPLPPDSSIEDQIRWYMNREPKKTIAKLFHGASFVHSLNDLAGAQAECFLRSFLPWLVRCLKHASDETEHPIAYMDDGICDCSDETAHARELPHAMRAASERLARTQPERFVELCAEWATSDMRAVHVLLSYGYEQLARKDPAAATKYLLADPRRLKLAEPGDANGRTIALLKSLKMETGAEDAAMLELCILESEVSSQGFDKPVGARRAARMLNREHRLRLLQAMPAECLSTRARAHIEAERQVFGMEARGRRKPTGFQQVGSAMSAAQMERARDQHILGLFEELPDETGFQHPKRFLMGGAIEAGRELAALARKQPDRAIEIIQQMQPEKNQTPVALVIEALAETDISTQVLCELVVSFAQRGFASEQFRSDVAGALERRASKGLPEAVLTLFKSWLADVPTGSRTKPALSAENRGTPPFLTGLGAGSSISLPQSTYTILGALLVALLSSTPSRAGEWLSVLQGHVERDEEPVAWRGYAHRLQHLQQCERQGATAFLARLFSRYPDALECAFGVQLIAHVAWWVDAKLVHQWVKALAQNSWHDAPTAIGELTALLAIRREPLAWAEQDLAHIVEQEEPASGLLRGATDVTSDLWQDPSCRWRATPYMVALIRRQDSELDHTILRHLALDDVGTDDLAVQLLHAFATRDEPLPLGAAHDAVSWITKFIQVEPAAVYKLVANLVANAVTRGSHSDGIEAAAEPLVKLALTFQRMPEFRDKGLGLFETLLELDLYGARGALDEIDALVLQAR